MYVCMYVCMYLKCKLIFEINYAYGLKRWSWVRKQLWWHFRKNCSAI